MKKDIAWTKQNANSFNKSSHESFRLPNTWTSSSKKEINN